MTIEHKAEQGTPAWFRARQGIPTASAFHKIVTPAKAQLSKQSVEYAYKLVCERLLNMPIETVEASEWMTRGKELEPMAASQYEFLAEKRIRKCGFFTTDDGMIGASPDRVIIGEPGGVEIKSPAPWTHLGYLLDGPGEHYRPQVMGQMLVCDFEFVDFSSYHPRMPPGLIHTVRDEVYIGKLRIALDEFSANLLSMIERACALGVFQALEDAATPTDIEHAAELDAAFREDFGLPPVGQSLGAPE